MSWSTILLKHWLHANNWMGHIQIDFSIYSTLDRVAFKCALGPLSEIHDDVIKWIHFPHYWPVVRGIHRSPVNSPHKGQWRGALMFSLICVWINSWINNRKAGDLRRYRAHYDVIVMELDHTELRAWIGNHIQKRWSVFNHPFSIFNVNIAKQLFKLGHIWVNIFNETMHVITYRRHDTS